MPIAYGQTATDPTTGHRIVLTPQGWVALGSQQMQLPEADSKSMEALQQQAQDAQFLDQKAQQFIKGMDPRRPGQGSFATGPVYTPIGEFNPVATYVGSHDPRMGDLESITNQAWVHMRPQGSGAIRGYEASAFKDAFPNVTHWGPENQAISDRLHQDAVIASQKLGFIDNFIRSGQGDYAAANAAWQNMGNGAQYIHSGQQAAPSAGMPQAVPQVGPEGRPMPPPVDSSIPVPGGPKAGTIEDGFVFRGGNPGDPANWSPAPGPQR